MKTAVLQRIRQRLRAARGWLQPPAANSDEVSWQALPPALRVYVAVVLVAGAWVFARSFPTSWPHPILFVALLVVSCVTSAWKVSLPIAIANGSTLSVSYAADLTSLVLLGWPATLVVAVAGAWTQCTVKVRCRYPWYRTAFSLAAEALTIAATGFVYTALRGPIRPTDFEALAPPLVGAIATYFLVNTVLVACAIGLSLHQSIWKVWHDDFMWSAPSFMVAGGAGAIAAIIIARGQGWLAVLMLAPVYLIYCSYDVFLRRLEDEVRHGEENRRLHREALDALQQARRAEQALAAEKERLAVTLRSIGDGVITVDLDGTILLMNSVAESLTGWMFDEVMGRNVSDVFQSVDPETRRRLDELVPAAAAAMTASHQSATRAAILIGRDLSERPIEVNAAPLRDRDGSPIGVVLAFRDITDALRIQEERVKASKLSSLGLLAGGIAHDFNNVLMAIMGNISIARATTKYGATALNALGDAEQACVRARQLTWQLLTFSKGGVPLKKTLSMVRLIQESTTTALRGSAVSCAMDVPADLWPVHADEAQLIQVFTNVLINAQEAMPHGGTVSVTAHNVTESEMRREHTLPAQHGDYVRVSISDVGIGIPREHVGRIFDPYFSTKQRGSGLGLATTYSIVKNHGGHISVDSTLGRGTTVHINLPVAANREQVEPITAPVAAAPGRNRILVMDDEPSVRTLAVNMLQFLGYDAEVVENGSAAVERFGAALRDGCPFQAVMLDLIVPGEMGAADAIDQLAGLDPTIKAILVSGYAQDSVLSAFRDRGFQAVITKPYTLQELRATLNSVIPVPMWRVH